MSGASGSLKVHDIELLVEEGVEFVWSHFHSSVSALKHLVIHVVESWLSIGDLEELTELLMWLCLRIEVHLGGLLQFLVSLVLFLSPNEFLLGRLRVRFLEEGWLPCIDFPIVLAHFSLELLLGLLSFRLFLIENFEELIAMIVFRFQPKFHICSLLSLPLKLFSGILWLWLWLRLFLTLHLWLLVNMLRREKRVVGSLLISIFIEVDRGLRPLRFFLFFHYFLYIWLDEI